MDYYIIYIMRCLGSGIGCDKMEYIEKQLQIFIKNCKENNIPKKGSIRMK